MAEPYAPLLSLALALLVLAATAAAVLLAPIGLRLTLSGQSAAAGLHAELSFWGQSFASTYDLDWPGPPGAARRAATPGRRGAALGAVLDGIRAYRAVARAIADQGRLRALTLEGRLSLGDPARTALALGLLEGVVGARYAGVAVRSVALAPHWGGRSFEGRATGIFRWRGVDIMVALIRTLRALGVLRASSRRANRGKGAVATWRWNTERPPIPTRSRTI